MKDFKDYLAVHDLLFDVFNKSFTNEEIDKMMEEVPENTQLLGQMWGWGDTEFREIVGRYFRKKYE